MNVKKNLSLSSAAIFALLAGCAGTERAAREVEEPVRVSTVEPNAIPAGTEFSIRVNETIDTEVPVMDRTYAASFTQAILSENGDVLVPKGSPAELVVIETEEAGTLGTPSLTLALRSVTVNGRRHAVYTSTQEREGEEGIGVNPRTGVYVGGGAALGTVLGAIVGGEKGAVIGGVLGGAAGGAAQVLTRGDEVQVPAGTILEFRLNDTWRLEPAPAPAERPIS